LKVNTSIKRLALEVYDLDHSNTPAIAEMLQCNSTLESFDLHVRNRMKGDDCLLSIACALKDNSNLTSLELYNRRGVQESTEQAFSRMLQTNTTLRGLRLLEPSTTSSQSRNQIELYLKLNRRGGRKRILRDFEHLSRGEWVEVLARESYDGDFLYYFLRLNPLLCQIDSKPGTVAAVVTEQPAATGVAVSSCKNKRQWSAQDTGLGKRRKCTVEKKKLAALYCFMLLQEQSACRRSLITKIGTIQNSSAACTCTYMHDRNVTAAFCQFKTAAFRSG
jgi:hypothetical protein